MANERVRYTERSWRSIILEADPDFYSKALNTNRTEYEFSNGRKFTGHKIYDNYAVEES